MHKPVHPHSHSPDRKSDGEETSATEPPTGPFSASAENGYRPTSRVSVPNPYTTRRVEVDDVDTGANPVGQWRGVGLDEPEPRSKPTLATTDTMTETPSSPESTERPEAPVPPTTEQRPAPGPSATPVEPARLLAEPAQRTQPQPHHQPTEVAMPEASGAPRPEADRPTPQGAPAPSSYAGPSEPAYDPRGQEPPAHHPQQPAPQGPPPAYDPYAQQGHPFQGHVPPGYGHQGQGYPARHEPAPYHPQRHEGHAPPAHYPSPYQQRVDYPVVPPYPAPQPAPYPHPLVTYQNAYPAPYQPPGYVLPGQPVVYPGQFHPYGQPVQHVIVLSAGQQPQVITAESAATLFAERSETTASEEVAQNKALTGSESAEESTDESRAKTEEETPSPSAAEDTDSSTEVASEKDEIAKAKAEVAEAVSEVLRDSKGELLNEALAGLAMRDLSLVDALLEMVESLETDAQDPDLLDKLFQIDNFATRMRRNGENLLVLTGHDGGESDAHDEIVPLLDVARAATSEIKDYPRVSLGKLPQTSITGLAADDISHLLAELLDNATANSPEHSQVVISAQEMDDGRLMIIVEDEGVGIPEAQLVELNSRLDGEPVLDDEVPKHMGLYVASRIAQKHGLETRLESRSFRGVSAYTIIPKDLLRVATTRQPGQARTSTTPATNAPVSRTVPQQPSYGGGANGNTGNGANGNGANGGPKASPAASGGNSSVTSAGLPRRSATPHGSPLRMMPHPGSLSDNPPPPPKGREDTPPKLTGEARAEQIRDELGDFLDGERAALEGKDLEDGKE